MGNLKVSYNSTNLIDTQASGLYTLNTSMSKMNNDLLVNFAASGGVSSNFKLKYQYQIFPTGNIVANAKEGTLIVPLIPIMKKKNTLIHIFYHGDTQSTFPVYQTLRFMGDESNWNYLYYEYHAFMTYPGALSSGGYSNGWFYKCNGFSAYAASWYNGLSYDSSTDSLILFAQYRAGNKNYIGPRFSDADAIKNGCFVFTEEF